MAEKEPRYPLRKQVPSREWSPGIHYAQFQTLSPCLFPRRRLYDFELLYVRQVEIINKDGYGGIYPEFRTTDISFFRGISSKCDCLRFGNQTHWDPF